MSLPLISVIVPVYNVKDFLPACLDSIKNQTYKNLEIILVDDGSNDGSEIYVDGYGDTDKRAKIFHKKNGGLSAARNFGFSKATGEYVTFVDSDDCLVKDAIEYWYGLIQKYDAEIAVSSHTEKKENGKTREFNNGEYHTGELSVEKALSRMLNERGFMMSAWGKLYSRRVMKGIKFPDGKLHEDVGTTYRFFLAMPEGAKVAYGAKSKYIYNIRSQSITNTKFDSRKIELISQTDVMCDEIDRAYPGLINTTRLRRVHARFSILRQLDKKTKGVARLEEELIDYVKEHKDWVMKNPEASKRDKMAMRTLMLGKPVFSLAWKLYGFIR